MLNAELASGTFIILHSSFRILVVPSCFGGKYAAGLVEGPRTKVYVNRGIGVTGLPARFNCRPEVTLLRLKRAGEGASARS